MSEYRSILFPGHMLTGKLTVSPSRLAHTEACPKFRPTPFRSKDADQGVDLHEVMEEMCLSPRDGWEDIMARHGLDESDREAALDAADRTFGPYAECGFRAFGEKQDPHAVLHKWLDRREETYLFPEFEIVHPGGRMFLDLLVVSPEEIRIFDYKFIRNPSDYTLQIGAYALAVKALVSEPDIYPKLRAETVSPYLRDDGFESRIEFDGKQDYDRIAGRIRNVLERYDDPRSTWSPGAQCEKCRFNGQCPAQAGTLADVGRHSPAVAGLDASVFAIPDASLSPRERSLRRYISGLLEGVALAVKKQDKEWAAGHPGEDMPGYKISWCKGKKVLDKSRTSEIYDKLRSTLGIDYDTLLACSDVDLIRLAEALSLTTGVSVAKSKTLLQDTVSDFMNVSAPYPTFRVDKRAFLEQKG